MNSCTLSCRWHVLLLLVCATVLTAACEPGSEAQLGVRKDALSGEVPSDDAKRTRILDILEAFIPHAESYWRTSNIAEARTGRYDAVGSGVTQPRGAGNLAFAYATLLAAYPARAEIGGVAREVLLDHTVQSIRHEALTNRLSGAGYNWWGNGTWQASLETYGWGFAAYLLWAELDDDTRSLVRRVVAGEATILVTKPLASNEEGDTGAEDNAWNAPTPALAAVMFPEDPRVAAWEESAIRLALNASSTSADETSDTIIDGRPLGAWMASVNLHPDLTLENHGFFNPIYQQVVHVSIGDAAIFYGAADHPQPEAFSFRAEAVWDAVLGPLATDDGDFAMPAGQDWTSKDYQHLAYLSVLATRFGRAAPSAYEARALELVARRQAAQGTGSLLGQGALGYETMLIQRLAAAWWNHQLFGPSPAPTPSEVDADRRPLRGVRRHPYSGFIAGRLGGAFASVSWDAARPMALLVPDGEPFADDPVFTYYAPGSLMGSAGGPVGPYFWDGHADRFSTAGTVGARRFSMTTFPDGLAILLDEGAGATFTYALESIAGVTGDRTVWSSAGAGLGALSGDWLNAADRLGMIVRGGAGLSAEVNGVGTLLTGSTGTGTGHRAALLLPLSSHEQTAQLAPYARPLALPDGWAGLSARAPDASLRVALARWSGPAGVTVTLEDERGAPVPESHAILFDGTSTFEVFDAAPSSRGDVVRTFVRAGAQVRSFRSGDAVHLVNPGADDAPLVVTRTTVGGSEQTARRSLLAGEQTDARDVEGALTLAGPELEPLLAAEHALTRALAAGHAPRRISRTLFAARDLVVQALAESRAERPNAPRAARAVERALSLLLTIERERHVPAPVLGAVAAAITALREAESLGYGVALSIVPPARVQPGETVTFRVVARNRSARRARDGVVALTWPDGWSGPSSVTAFAELDPGASTAHELPVSVPSTAPASQDVPVGAELGYTLDVAHTPGCEPAVPERTAVASLLVPVHPLFTVALETAELSLAPTGYNEIRVALTSWATRPLSLTLTAMAVPGVDVAALPQVTLAAGESAVVALPITGVRLSTGRARVDLDVVSDSGVHERVQQSVRFTDDLALNASGGPWPRISANSSQAAYPAALANDGATSTFWVSAGTLSGEGPSAANPHWMQLDFGQPVTVGSVVMTPRLDYGPRAYDIQVSNDGAEFRTVASVPSAPNAAQTTTFGAPIVARYLRLYITASWDRQQPPRNVQIASLEVRPPEPGDLAANTTGATWPRAFASSAQAGYPAALAFDANASTFWVSSGTTSGQGPSPENPQYLGVDLGSPFPVASIDVVPRVGYGPTAYTVEASNDDVAWTTLAIESAVPNGVRTTSFAPVTVRYVRVRITGSWDRVQPPRNVQVASLRVHAP